MIYYLADTFSPITKQHFNFLSQVCELAEQSKTPLSPWDSKTDRIALVVLPLKDEKSSGIPGHHLCSSMEYRLEMMTPVINFLMSKYPVVKDCIEIYFGDDEKLVEKLLSEKSELSDIDKTTFDLRSWAKTNFTEASNKVRDILYRNPYTNFDEVKDYLLKDTFDAIKENHHYWQYGYEDTYRAQELLELKKYDSSKYLKPSVTATMIVIREPDKVLLVRRKNFPYKGYWSLPGGFFDVNEDDNIEDTAGRELVEETNIPFTFTPKHQFRVYSDFGTDPRGRIVNVVFAIKDDFPPKAGDDASEVKYFSFNELPRMAFNHRQIIEDYIRRYDPEEEHDFL